MIHNKYYNWYNSIVNSATAQCRQKGAGTYYELHHILPKSMGGTDEKSNLVLLTAKEHVVCHHLLTKMTTGQDKSKMLYAYWSLINGWGDHRKKHRITPRQYAKLKEEIAMQISEMNSGRIGIPCSPENKEAARKRMLENNPMKGKVPFNKGTKRPGIGGRKKGTGWSQEERLVQMEVRSRPGYHDFLSDPARAKKISETQKGRPGTSTGTIWCNDGVNEYQVTELPDGYKKGRLITNSSKKGMRWFNDGTVNRQFKDGSEPEGFKHGRIPKK